MIKSTQHGCPHVVQKIVFPRGVGTDLPNDERGVTGQHILLEARCLVRRLLAANTNVKDVDFLARKLSRKGIVQSAGIGSRLAACTIPFGRRGANRDDPYIVWSKHGLGKARQIPTKS